jgi:hypothetical protein
MKLKAPVLLVLWAALYLGRPVEANQIFQWQGQVSSWLTITDNPDIKRQLGLRFIPTFSLKKDTGKKWAMDAEASFNAFGTISYEKSEGFITAGEIKPYRLWARLVGPQFEARLGLQKINFGSALLLRPLMWFDRIDPNDPLQLTEGVTALLLRYTFLNNANIWLWGLYGNDDLKGWETEPSRSGTFECGGRFQFPFFSGETALTYHHRTLDPQQSVLSMPPGEEAGVAEDRWALDGKWDIGIGVWLEAALVHKDFRVYPFKYQKMLNLGLDSTMSLGNGLHIIVEHLWTESSSEISDTGGAINFTVLSLDYLVGILDRAKAVVFHNWKTGDWYRFLTWQRTYDLWSFYLIGFWNPDRYQIYTSQKGKSLFAGKGVQLMAAFNF